MGLKQVLADESEEGWVEGTLLDEEPPARDLGDAEEDPVAVEGA